MKEMFCFQCEQTVNGKGCMGRAGVCEKRSQTSNLQDELIGSLIGLVRSSNCSTICDSTNAIILDGLFTTITNVNFDDQSLINMIQKIRNAKQNLIPQCGASFVCDSDDYDMRQMWEDNEDIRSLKSLILFGIKGIAAYAYHAYSLGYQDKEVMNFFYKALSAIGQNLSTEDLLKIVLETGAINLKCMELLDKANTEKYGVPNPVVVPLTIEQGPFIVISGHDLHDLQLLLEQTKGKGINIYTHSEMLPAHGYPKLKEYPHLKGNFGTAWQNQQKEFDNIPAPILFTTNCLMAVRESYKDRVFTTAVVRYPDLIHIGEDKDFTPLINKALELGGYKEDKRLTGINGGDTVMTGFAHGAVLANADKIINAVKDGAIKHFFLVGGCDGAKPGRNYYTEFVKKTPKDTIILTVACGKYRFNDLNIGSIGGMPRILDMGQCNDAYSAIKVAIALSNAFNCSVNDLPLTLVLSWYEQKAVAILLTLLHLGIKNIYIGPTLPAFISSGVLDILVQNYNITPISTPENDLQKILK